MYERSLHEAECILASRKEVLVLVKEVWREVAALSHKQGFEVASLPDFTAMLEADGRFDFIPASRIPEEVQGELFEQEEEGDEGAMVQMGFLSEDRVKLRRIHLSEEENVGEEEELGSITRKNFNSSVQKRPRVKVSRSAPNKTRETNHESTRPHARNGKKSVKTARDAKKKASIKPKRKRALIRSGKKK